MNEDQQFQLCLKELEILQGTIARYDNNGSNIKSWCVTIWSAVSAYAISERESATAILAIAIIVGFGIVELTYRRFQRRFILRAGLIENLLETGSLKGYSYSIHRSAEQKSQNEYKSVLRLPHFTFFYIALVIFSCAVFAYCLSSPDAGRTLFLKLNGY